MFTCKLVKVGFITALALIWSVLAQAQLHANFTATPTSGCAPLVVHFTDQSTGNPLQWRWDLGNGTTSVLANPSVTYFNPGTYSIKLIVQNAIGIDSVIRTQYITVYAQPVVQFGASVRSACAPFGVQFHDSSTLVNGNFSQWQWDFGDGQTSSQQHPYHVYTASGFYNISLRITSSAGCTKTLTKTQYIRVFPVVNAAFTFTLPNRCTLPIIANFSNTSSSTNSTLTYAWNFGEGSTSTQNNPAHIYSSAGNFLVSLIATNNFGCRDTAISTVSINNRITDFTSPTPVCANTDVTFNNTSSPTPTTSNWNFGDGTASSAISPVKQYNSPGVYQVKLVNTYGSCRDSVTRSIEVQAKPTAGFTADTLKSCKTPFSVQFTNQSIGASSYLWFFGDGDSSRAANPAHIYTNTGSFSVTLIVTNAVGCTDTLVRTAYINIALPIVNFFAIPREGCSPLTVNFNTTFTAFDSASVYSWDFGDGSTGNSPNPVHVFTTGTYTIQLSVTTVNGCSDTAMLTNGIRVGDRPLPRFVAMPPIACAWMEISFADSSLGNPMPDRWLWSFGDGGTSTAQFPTHHYSDTGTFSIQLIVWSNGCADSLLIDSLVTINPPIAKFRVAGSCTNKTQKTFTDISIGADAWNWDFGDGTLSTEQHPVHNYSGAGIFTVTLIVFNNETGCSDTTTRNIRVINENAEFTVSPSRSCRGSAVNFVALADSIDIQLYSWSFGDGSSATGKIASHTYNANGTFTVRLIVKDRLGCSDTLRKIQYVYGPTASFSVPNTISCRTAVVNFTDQSQSDGTNPISNWIWSYGDGTIDTVTTPPFSHNYSNPGTYAVTLTVADTMGCSHTFTQNAAVTIAQPVAAFRTNDTVVCAGTTVRFTNTSAGTNLTYQWTFGDGGTNITRNPVYSYNTDGIYTVKLKIRDSYGCTDSLTRMNYINVASPVAAFATSDTFGTCPPLIVNFTNQSINYTSLNWDFGDATGTTLANPLHFYSTPGTYYARLTVTKLNCTSTAQQKIVVLGPSGSFSYDSTLGCAVLPVNFRGRSLARLSFIWDFSDGTTLPTTDSIVHHDYAIPGNYLPRMILVDANGCMVPIDGTDTIRVKGVNTAFNASINGICNPLTAQFTDSSSATDPITTYQWQFGDGGTSTAVNPSHVYTTSGNFIPQLNVITAAGCKDTFRLPSPIRVVLKPKGRINSPANGCNPLTSQFSGSLLTQDTSAIFWNWNLGNGQSSSLQNPPVQLYPTGTYTVTLQVSNSSGCTDTLQTTITSYPTPNVDAGVDTSVCNGSQVQLQASGAATYNWSPATTLNCSNCTAPLASPVEATTYYVTGTSQYGCINRDSVKVKVWYDFTMNASKGDTMCFGSSRQLMASGAYQYQWTPTIGLNNPTSPNPIASPSVTTIYTVTGKDAHGCFSHSARIPIVVFPIPQVEAGEDKTINAGQQIDLIPTISADVINAIWTPNLGGFRTQFPGITVKPRETTTFRVEVKNAGGCKAFDFVTVHVLCNDANVFIPNTFSPNGDGVNELFYPRGSGLFTVKTMRVYNRWGEMVFQANNFKANEERSGWDGKIKGSNAPSDVYVYIVEVMCDNNIILPIKGNITLLR